MSYKYREAVEKYNIICKLVNMNNFLQNISFTAIAVLFSASLLGQNNLAVERFVADENVQNILCPQSAQAVNSYLIHNFSFYYQQKQIKF
jgi:hypothetical protein